VVHNQEWIAGEDMARVTKKSRSSEEREQRAKRQDDEFVTDQSHPDSENGIQTDVENDSVLANNRD
jgi:hypothetical protein